MKTATIEVKGLKSEAAEQEGRRMGPHRRRDESWLYERLAARKRRRWLRSEDWRADLVVLGVMAIVGLITAAMVVRNASKEQGGGAAGPGAAAKAGGHR